MIKINDDIRYNVPDDMISLMDYVCQAGYTAWLVGGCVRDMARQQIPDDFDIATDARPDEIIRLFPRHALTGYEHGTITVFWHKWKIEMTTLRTETDYRDSRRPGQVNFHGDLQSDLARRDFTINSMAWNPEQGLIDLFGGLNDLRQKKLRCVGDPASRFSEDALRMLRAVRFSVVLGFKPESDLLHAAVTHSHLISRLSRERIWTELKRIATGACTEQISAYSDTGVIRQALGSVLGKQADDSRLCLYLGRYGGTDLRQEQIVPVYLMMLEMASDDSDKTAEKHEERILEKYLTAYRHQAYRRQIKETLIRKGRLSRTEASWTAAVFYWMYLSHDLMKSMQLDEAAAKTESPASNRLKNDLIKRLSLLYREVGQSKEMLMTLVNGAQSLYMKFARLSGHDDAAAKDERAVYFFRLQHILDQLNINQTPLSVLDLAVNGQDLMKAGLSQGPEIQQALNKLLAHVIDCPEDNKRLKLLEWYKNLSDI